MFSDKAARECLGRLVSLEVDGDDDRIFVLIVFEPCRRVVIAIEPLTHRGHHGRKPICQQPDRDRAHTIASLSCILLSVSTVSAQSEEEKESIHKLRRWRGLWARLR